MGKQVKGQRSFVLLFAACIIIYRCPAPDQTFITSQNTWQKVQGQANELETGLVSVLQLSQGSSLNLHCTVKLCFPNHATSCEKVTLKRR